LKANPHKSTLFCSGTSQVVSNQIASRLQIREGKLHVQYLGVPLISTRLSASDYSDLLDKIVGRIDSWLSKKLSFVWQLQLISFVLYNIHVYWSSIFILPKKIIKAIEQKFSSFLCNGKVEGVAKAKGVLEDTL
jgi:hypothetical protein